MSAMDCKSLLRAILSKVGWVICGIQLVVVAVAGFLTMQFEVTLLSQQKSQSTDIHSKAVERDYNLSTSLRPMRKSVENKGTT